MEKLSPLQRRWGIKRILGAVSEAYGRMMLYEGLFQADGHPGNILVMKGGAFPHAVHDETPAVRELQQHNLAGVQVIIIAHVTLMIDHPAAQAARWG